MTWPKGELIISFKRSISPDLFWEFLHFYENGSTTLVQCRNSLLTAGIDGYSREDLTIDEGISLAAEWLKADKSITSHSMKTNLTEIITL